jgi:hypothetical protein
MSTFRAVFLGFVVAAIALVIADARRVNSAVAVPSHIEVTYTIPAGAAAPGVALPVSNSPVTINLAVVSGAIRGASSVLMCHTTAAPATMAWCGHSPVSDNPGGTTVGGSTTTANGATIVFLNAPGDVVLRISNAVNKVEIFNGTASTVTAVLEMTY